MNLQEKISNYLDTINEASCGCDSNCSCGGNCGSDCNCKANCKPVSESIQEDLTDSEKHDKLNDIFQALERLNSEVEELHSLDADLDSSGAGDLTDQITTMSKYIQGLYQVLDRSSAIVPMEDKTTEAGPSYPGEYDYMDPKYMNPDGSPRTDGPVDDDDPRYSDDINLDNAPAGEIESGEYMSNSYGMFSQEGDDAVHKIVRYAHQNKINDWERIDNALTKLGRNKATEEATDTEVRERVWAKLTDSGHQLEALENPTEQTPVSDDINRLIKLAGV